MIIIWCSLSALNRIISIGMRVKIRRIRRLRRRSWGDFPKITKLMEMRRSGRAYFLTTSNSEWPPIQTEKNSSWLCTKKNSLSHPRFVSRNENREKKSWWKSDSQRWEFFSSTKITIHSCFSINTKLRHIMLWLWRKNRHFMVKSSVAF